MGADLIERLNQFLDLPRGAVYMWADTVQLARDSAAEIVRLRGEVAEQRRQMGAVWRYVQPNASNDMEWADEIIIAIDQKTIAPAEAKGQTDHKGRPMTYWGGTPGSPQPAGGEAVAWIKPDWQNPANYDGKSPVTTYPQAGWIPLYTTPPAPVQAAPQEGCPFCGGTGGHWEGCRAPVDTTAHPSACDLVVDEAMFARLALAYMERHDVLQICWGDMAGLSQEDGTAALQHRGDSRGGEGSGG